MKPYFEAPGIQLFLGDALEILPTIEAGTIGLCLTDPPYGISYNHEEKPLRPSCKTGVKQSSAGIS